MKFTLHKQNNTILFLVWNFLSTQCKFTVAQSDPTLTKFVPYDSHFCCLWGFTDSCWIWTADTEAVRFPLHQVKQSEARRLYWEFCVDTLPVFCPHVTLQQEQWHHWKPPEHTGTPTYLPASNHPFLELGWRRGVERDSWLPQASTSAVALSRLINCYSTSLHLYINIFVSLLKEVFISRVVIFLSSRVGHHFNELFSVPKYVQFCYECYFSWVLWLRASFWHIWLLPPQEGLDASLPSPVQKSPVLLSSPSSPCPVIHSPTKPCVIIWSLFICSLLYRKVHSMSSRDLPAHCPPQPRRTLKVSSLIMEIKRCCFVKLCPNFRINHKIYFKNKFKCIGRYGATCMSSQPSAGWNRRKAATVKPLWAAQWLLLGCWVRLCLKKKKQINISYPSNDLQWLGWRGECMIWRELVSTVIRQVKDFF